MKAGLKYALAIGAYVVTLYTLWLTIKVDPVKLTHSALLSMTPLALAAIGEVLNEKGGLVNIGLDGIMLMTAAIGVWGAEASGSGYIGLLVGLLVGGLVGLIMGLMSTYGKAAQIVAGIGVNIFAYGFTPFFIMAMWRFPGIRIPPKEVLAKPRTIVFNGVYFDISEVTIIAIILAFLIHYIIYKTPVGLRIRACGEAPEAADVAGVGVYRVRVALSTLGGALAGLGGAFMSLVWFGGVVKEISAGRGFLALGCVVASGLEPIPALGFAFIFGFAEALAYSVAVAPGVKEIVPYHIVYLLPYITVLVVVSVFMRGKRFPRALGLPYIKE